MPGVQEPPDRPASASPARAAASGHPPADEAERGGGLRGFFVGVILVGVFTATLGMVTFIWYRWHDVREPTTAVIVEGDATLDGTLITVRGKRVITTTLSESNGYIAPVLLEPGRYLVTAEHEGQIILRQEIEVKRFLGKRFDLTKFLESKHTTKDSPAIAPPPDSPPPSSSAENP